MRSDRFPYVEVVVTIGTWSNVIWAYIDTGFDGGLLLPARIGRGVYADPDYGPFRVADDYVLRVPCWPGTLELNGTEYSVDVAAVGSRCLLGRQVTDNLTVCFER